MVRVGENSSFASARPLAKAAAAIIANSRSYGQARPVQRDAESRRDSEDSGLNEHEQRDDAEGGGRRHPHAGLDFQR